MTTADVPSPRQLAGLWEIPLFLLSIPLAAGTAWLLVSALHPPVVVPPVEPAVPERILPVEKPPTDLARALSLAASGRTAEALKLVQSLREAASTEAQRREADLAHAAILERAGEPVSLAEAVRRYAELRATAGTPEEAAQARLWESRAAWRLFQAEPSHRAIGTLQGILASVRESSTGLVRPVEADESAFLEGEILESLGRLEEAEQAFRRISPTEKALKAASLLRIAGCYRKQRPPGLHEAHAAVLEAERHGLGVGSVWLSRPEAEREVELLAQDWREAEDDAKALEVEGVLQRTAEDPAEHYVHAAEIHERRAERLQAQAAASGDAKAAEAAREAARGHDLSAGRLYRTPLDLDLPARSADLVFRAARAFERARDLEKAVSALERFTIRYTDDPRFPQAVYLLGRRYRDLGLHAKALALFERARPGMREDRGSVHYVPLSLYEEGLCQYLSGAEGSRARAAAIFERILDHPDIYPDSQTWRDSLFALATMEYEDVQRDAAARPRARARLAEFLERYPKDARVPQVHMMAGRMAWDAEAWAEAAASFRAVADQVYVEAGGPSPRLLALGRSASLLAAEASYRQGLKPMNPALLAEARERFSDARDLNLGTWRAPWALARMADCSRALGREAEAKGLYDLARFEYAQMGPSAGPPPEGTEGLDALVAWRAEAGQWLGRP